MKQDVMAMDKLSWSFPLFVLGNACMGVHVFGLCLLAVLLLCY